MRVFLLLGVLFFDLVTLSAQNEEDYLFQYMDEGVQEVRYGKKKEIIYQYQYKPGLIIERDCCPMEFEARYFYTEKGKVDSILFLVAVDSAEYWPSRATFEYNDRGMLETCILEDSIAGPHMRKTFVYNSDNFLDSMVTIYFRSEPGQPADTSYTTNKYQHDSQGRLISMTSKGIEEIRYSYDKDGRLLGRAVDYGLQRNGCIVDGSRNYQSTTYHYNNQGLIRKEVNCSYSLTPEGKKTRKRKYKNTYEYKLYE